MNIRRMTAGDSRAVSALCRELGYNCSAAQVQTRFERLPSDHLTLVAEEGGEVVGWLHAGWHPTLTSDVRIEILGLVISEARRQQGIGRGLVEEAERWAQQVGCRQVRVRSNEERQNATRFYERLGYRTTKTQKVFDKETPESLPWT